MPAHFVSVIIPVFNDCERLNICLRSLENQTYPKDLYEVIVVDNNSEEDIESLVKQFSQVRITHESLRGSYAARNKGISVAKGYVFAFTDSDCIPTSTWIEKGVECLLQTPNTGLVAGKVEIFFQDPTNPTAVELYDSMNFLRQKHYVENMKFGATANMFTFKDVFEAVGLFNSELKSGGDQEWGERVFAAGYKQVYADDVCIAHPARRNLKDLQKKVIRITEGHYGLVSHNEELSMVFFKEIVRDIKPPIKSILKILVNKKLQGMKQKIEYIYVVLSLKYLRAWKKIQLYLQHSYYRNKHSRI
ncbi:glycosyltransferase [Fischerella sp. PCC 9605]|uniref:glycosyltransferase n=1 Tax=Fischerella sp. PCC 9605 TaxID=1173024 RepID=UPI0004BC3E79|nr:glycosyltransferase [Fischerella sp. PCC 9605]